VARLFASQLKTRHRAPRDRGFPFLARGASFVGDSAAVSPKCPSGVWSGPGFYNPKIQNTHASGCWIEYEPTIGGRDLVARRMIVESSIPLDHEEPGFDVHAATDLQREAKTYAKAKHLRRIIFVRKY
jgi:hypothetical protein